MRHFIPTLLVAAVVLPAAAQERVPPVADPLTAKECGACHMAFPPQFLPQRSWTAIMSGLDKHFGEDASLPDDQRDAILSYLLAHAGDTKGAGAAGSFARSVPKDAVPLRIIETPGWIKEHAEVSKARWADPKVKSKANCAVCHTKAAEGVYEED